MSDIKPITEILVPMDFSASSINALEYAKRLLEPTGARLHLLYVDDDPMLLRASTSQKIRDEHEDRMAMRFVDLLPAEQRERYRTVMAIKCGTAYYEIETYAAEHAIDLIIIGRVGRSAIADAVLGSVAAHVVKHSPCPVLAVVHHPEHQ